DGIRELTTQPPHFIDHSTQRHLSPNRRCTMWVHCRVGGAIDREAQLERPFVVDTTFDTGFEGKEQGALWFKVAEEFSLRGLDKVESEAGLDEGDRIRDLHRSGKAPAQVRTLGEPNSGMATRGVDSEVGKALGGPD